MTIKVEPVLGVRELRDGPPTPPQDIVADIVAVHGLGGHAFNTWTHSGTGTFWIRDLLQDRLPGTRTLAFGFNARKKNHNAELDFEDVATQLIAGLSHLRAHEEEQKRPIVFLAHSLGGLIVKKAITLATQQAAAVANFTRGIIFFATPHCGSNLADLAVTFERISKVIADPPNNFIRDLCTLSPALQSLDSQFRSFLADKKIPCISFYEGYKKKGFFRNSIVVNRDSAVLGIDLEEAICLNADHSSIVKYKNADDDNFKIVLSKLRELLERIKSVPAETKRRRNSANVHVPFLPGKYFVGRKHELAQLHDWLGIESKHEAKTVALYGLSGVGKTQLALKYAIEHRDLYEWVLFVNASSQEVLRNDFTKIQNRITGSGDAGSSIDKMVSWLASRTEDRWLLIMDNANHLPDVVPYISRLFHAGHIIVTTQDARVDKNEFIQASLEVRTLDPEESRELLFARAGLTSPMKEDVEVAESLLKEMGHLPLAIDSAGAYINVRRKSVTEYASLFHKFQKDVLDHRPQASSYDRSVVGTLELNFKEIDCRPEAYALLCLFVFLDRAEVTEDFLKRGVTEQLSWGPSGEPVKMTPEESHVPPELIELINNDFKFDEAIEELISLSIITFTHRSATGKAFMLHPLYHKCAKFRMSREQRQKYAGQALMFLSHAFPSDEYALEKKDGAIGRAFVPHIYYAYESFKHPLNGLSSEYLESLTAASGKQFQPCELVAKLVLDANFTYGQGDTSKNAFLLTWIDELLASSSNMWLKARALEVRLALTYYEAGDYAGGVRACEEFLVSVKDAQLAKETVMDELTNSQVGIIEATLAELLVTEASASENFDKSKALLQDWSPLAPNVPSTKEKITHGNISRIHGKLLKDHGDWKESELQFKLFLDKYAVKRSQTEGWSAGDLAHVLMEQSRPEEAEEVLLKYLGPRQMFQTQDERAQDRRSDTMYLEMLLGESLMLQGKYDDADEALQNLLQHFHSFGKLWHFERFRVAFILTILARIRQQTGQLYAAIEYWEKTLKYCLEELDVDNQKGKWDRKSFMPSIAILSMSDCYFDLGNQDHAMVLQREASYLLESSNAQPWILGLGSYWLEWLKFRARKRDIWDGGVV